MNRRLMAILAGVALLAGPALCQATETTALTDSQQVFVQRYVRDLASSVKEPLLSELKAMLREGQKVSAIRKYRDASGADLSTAKRVVELLESRL